MTTMTNSKTPKRRKLRNSEYYDMQKVFDGLYADSKTGEAFTKLMPIIMSEENIRLAYRNLKTNSGSKTPGVNGKTIDDLKRWNDTDLIRNIQKFFARYTPGKVRRVEIPKGNGKTRPLGIPTIKDRLILQFGNGGQQGLPQNFFLCQSNPEIKTKDTPETPKGAVAQMQSNSGTLWKKQGVTVYQ